MLRDNRRYKYLRTLVCLGALGIVCQVSANPFMMGQSVAYSPEQWSDRWSSALSPYDPVRPMAVDPAMMPYQQAPNITPYYNPYSQRAERSPYNGFNDNKVVRPWGELPRKSKNKNAKRKHYEREKYRLHNRYDAIGYPAALPITNPYMNSFPYAAGVYPGVSPLWGTPGLSPGLISPYGVAPFGGIGSGWPVAPGLW